jgi:NAD(P)-dependent dehydrogenase (short-subunit alcohol dehydrogenase family)
LLAVKLDVTSPDDATAAAQAAVGRFGRVDVLVNNAGTFIAGFFEEISPDDFRAQVLKRGVPGARHAVVDQDRPASGITAIFDSQRPAARGLNGALHVASLCAPLSRP